MIKDKKHPKSGKLYKQKYIVIKSDTKCKKKDVERDTITKNSEKCDHKSVQMYKIQTKNNKILYDQ